jgi:5-methylcytosine-specific restriction protein A
MDGLILQPCRLSTRSNRENFIASVATTRRVADIAEFLDAEESRGLEAAVGGDEFSLWGAIRARQADFDKIRPGMRWLAIGDRTVHTASEVLYVFQRPNARLSRHLWPHESRKGTPWELIIVLRPPRPINEQYRVVKETLGFKPNFVQRKVFVYTPETDRPIGELIRIIDEAPTGTPLWLDPRAGSGRRAADVTDPAAVVAAMREFDELGRDAFLKRYDFGPSRRYRIVHEGRLYDSKPILGVAYRYAFPGQDALRHTEFSGGVGETLRILRALGFTIDATIDALAPGTVHDGRATVASYYGGRIERAITSLSDERLAIFSQRGVDGEETEPSSEHPFLYAVDPRAPQAASDERTLRKAMRTKDAVRFWVVEADGTVRFLTWVAVAGRVLELAGSGTEGEATTSEWILHPVPEPDTETWPDELIESIDEAVTAQRGRGRRPRPPADYAAAVTALDASDTAGGEASAGRRQRTLNTYERSMTARRIVRERAVACENPRCNGMPPDVTRDGRPILEVDHVVPLARRGPDHPSNMLAVCPNCHRAKTYGRESARWEAEFARVATELHEAALGSR